jgi:predicted alpha/beta hydrolase
MIEQERFETRCEDGVVLRGILLIPQIPKAVVQFNGGTAAKKEFYLPFLTYLAEQGYICCLWDYRGSGASAPLRMRGCYYKYRDYGMKDMPAIQRFLIKRYTDLPLLLFGHSVGGQQMAFATDLSAYKGMVGFAVSTGYFGNMTWRYRLLYLFFFYFFAPLSTLLWGYVRAKPFGLMENLPKNVVLEWRAWCRREAYFFDPTFAHVTVPTRRYEAIPFPMSIFWTTDDDISNAANTRGFWRYVTGCYEVRFRKIEPSEFGGKMINHFGFFLKDKRDTLWVEAKKELDVYVQSAAAKQKV